MAQTLKFTSKQIVITVVVSVLFWLALEGASLGEGAGTADWWLGVALFAAAGLLSIVMDSGRSASERTSPTALAATWDEALVERLGGPPGDEVLVRAVVQLARSLGLRSRAKMTGQVVVAAVFAVVYA